MEAISQQALMGRRIVERHERLMGLLELCWGGGQGELILVQPPLNIEVRLHEIFVALALGAQQGVGRNLQPLQDGGDIVGGERPARVGDQVLRHPVAETGGIEDHEGDPTGFNGGDGPGEHGARVAIQEEDAPPLDAAQGKIHLAAIDEPVLMRM